MAPQRGGPRSRLGLCALVAALGVVPTGCPRRGTRQRKGHLRRPFRRQQTAQAHPVGPPCRGRTQLTARRSPSACRAPRAQPTCSRCASTQPASRRSRAHRSATALPTEQRRPDEIAHRLAHLIEHFTITDGVVRADFVKTRFNAFARDLLKVGPGPTASEGRRYRPRHAVEARGDERLGPWLFRLSHVGRPSLRLGAKTAPCRGAARRRSGRPEGDDHDAAAGRPVRLACRPAAARAHG